MRRLGTMELITERLVLRRFRETDTEKAYENYGKDVLVNTYISFTPCDSLAGTYEFIRRHLWEYENNPDFYGWVITLDDEIIGSIGLYSIDHSSESCELGFLIGSKWWNRGYTTEAVEAVLKFAFNRMFAHRVQASHHPENTASKRVLEKVGMKFEGVMRDAQRNANGTYSDLWLYSKLSSD